MQLFTALSGDVLGEGFRGRILTSPVAWECKAHDDFLDSDVTLQWSGAPPTSWSSRKRTTGNTKGNKPKGERR